jgi:predicted permease
VAYLLAETLVLFFMGGVGGVFVAWVGTRALDLGALPLGMPVHLDFSPDGKVVGAALALALLTGCIFGVGPALWATKAGVAPLIKTGAGPAPTRLRRLFVVGQVAMSLVLVSVGLIFFRSAQHAAEMPRGFQAEGRYSVTVGLGLALDGSADEAWAPIRDVFDRVEESNVFRAMAISSGFPLDGRPRPSAHFREGTDDLERRRGEQVDRNIVSPGYFQIFAIPVLEGRAFDDGDEPGSPTVAMVNRAYAERYGGGERVIGRRFQVSTEGPFFEIVGVVANVPEGGLRTLGSPMIYLALAQYPPLQQVEVVVWEREGAEDTPGTLTRMLREANPELALAPVRSVEEVGRRLAMFDQRAGVAISSALALVGLLLSGLGLYGVVAFRVSSRRKEIGIRMALGAGHELVRKEVLWDGLKLAMPGVILGSAAAIGLARLLGFLLYEVGVLDPVVLLGVATLGLIVVGLASYGPARKASAIDPGVALRLE